MPCRLGASWIWWSRALVVLTLLFVSARVSFAQSSDTPAVAEPKPPTANGAKEIKPQVYYLKDKEGNLLPVPDMTLEDFKRLYDLSQGLRTDPPAYSLRSMKIVGQVREGKAELDVEVTVSTMAKPGSWVKVPLRFNSSVLREPPGHEGSGDFFLDFDPEAEGFVGWLRSPDESEHTLRFRFLTRVQELGAESRIALATPRATSGSLTLRVPEEKAKARSIRRSEESELDVKAEGKGSTIEMLGPAGEFQIAWRAGQGSAVKQRQTIEANGNFQIRLESKRRTSCEARLRMRSFGAPLETFTVRLPPGMRLTSFEQPGVQLTVLEPEIDEVSQKQIQIVEVRLASKTNGPVEVPLIAEFLRETGGADQPIEVGGFEVVDAVKQWGTIDLIVEGDQSAIWLEGAGVRRTEDATTADARGIKPLARFDYDAQPFSLQVQVVPRRTRVTVEPQYIVYVENQQLRLDATLKYKVRGAKTFNLEHNFEGWTIDRVGPETLVQTEAVLPEKKTPLSIPLIAAAVPSTGEFELKVQAHRDLPIDIREIRFDVPHPVGSSLTPGSLVIVPADNVELSTRSADLQGLVSDPLPSTLKLPPRQQMPLYYRELGGGTVARFLATFEVRQQMVSVASTTQARLDAGRISAEQMLDYNIAYEPLRNLLLDVPASLWEAGQLQFMLDGTSLPVSRMPVDPDVAVTPDRARVRVDLMADRIGRVELLMRYSIVVPPVAADGSQVAMPFAVPVIDGQLAKTNLTLRLKHSDQLDVFTKDEGWAVTQAYDAKESREPESTWTHATGAPQLKLELLPQETGNAGLITTEQVWIQTWLANDKRQDRAVFRITTAADRLRIKMPPGLRQGELTAAMNGRRISRFLLDPEGLLTLNLPAVSQATPVVIELWYEFETGRPKMGRMEFIPPRIQGGGEARRVYWQLVMPANEHLLLGPMNLSADLRWKWEDLHFGRTGRLSQEELERWIGGSVQTRLPKAANVYLFSSFGSLPTIEIRTVARRTALLACSGLVLVMGLALLYVPLARHPVALMLGGVGVTMLALWSPDTAIIVAQSAVAGLLCALLARILAGIYRRRPTNGIPLRGPSPSGIEARSTEPYQRYEPGSQTTTATIPLITVPPTELEP